MNLVQPEIARFGVKGLASANEWPYYLKFVGLISFDCVAIGPAEVLHGDLLLWIRNDVELATGSRLEFRDADVFDGYIEFESDTDLLIRTMDGKLLRREIEVEIRRFLLELKQRLRQIHNLQHPTNQSSVSNYPQAGQSPFGNSGICVTKRRFSLRNGLSF